MKLAVSVALTIMISCSVSTMSILLIFELSVSQYAFMDTRSKDG